MKNKKLLSMLCLFALVGCNNTGDVTTTTTPTPSTPEPVPHSVTVVEDYEEGGDVTLSSNNALAGTEINVTVSVNDGFSLESVTSNDVTVNGSEFTYNFVMPDAPVTINVDYSKLYTYKGLGNYTSYDFIVTNIKIGDSVKEGKVSVDVKAPNYTYGGIEAYPLTVNGRTFPGTVDALNANLWHYEIDVNADFKIYIMFQSLTDEDFGYTLSYVDGDNYDFVGIENGAKYTGCEFAVVVELGYLVSSVYYTMGDSEETFEIEGWSGRYYVELESDITIYVELESAEVYEITYTNTDKIANLYELPTLATAGSQVSFKLQAEFGYYLSEASFETTDVEAELNPQTWSDFYFVMPNAPLKINLSFSELESIEIVENPHILSYKFYSDDALTIETCGYIPDDGYVYMVFELEEGYAISSITGVYKDETIEGTPYISNWGSWSVGYIPAGGIILTVETVVAPKVTVVADEHVTATLDNGLTTGNYVPDSNVEITIVCEAGYSISSVTSSDENIHVSYSFDSWEECYIATFYMPENDITITIETEETKYVTVSVVVPESFEYFSLYGEAEGELNGTGSAQFVAGDRLTINYSTSSNQYSYTAYLVHEDGTEEELYESWGSIYATLPSDETAVSIIFKATENPSYSISYEAPEGVNLMFSVNYGDPVSADSVTTLYEGDQLNVVLNDEAPEGYKYVVKAYDNDNNEISANYGILIEKDLKIVVTLVEVVSTKLTIINNTTLGDDELYLLEGRVNYAYYGYSPTSIE